MERKPLKGIIRDWGLLNGCLIGVIIGTPNDIDIHTSRVVRIYSRNGIRFCETLNSIYVLV